MTKNKKLTTAAGAPVADNQNAVTAGPRGPMLMQDVWYQEKLAHFDREVIPERRMHAKGSGAFGKFTVTHDITRYTKAKIFSKDMEGAQKIVDSWMQVAPTWWLVKVRPSVETKDPDPPLLKRTDASRTWSSHA